ncbi:MAG: type II toxin-antitoxin system VapC family toxin, partial [Pseudanabaenales cyanobacterium]|nr:type II toxin-antitoxin system VapC family toxin [Pseudanabaenales cyanobacterium]
QKQVVIPQSTNWLQQITGSFKDEPAFEEVLAYGQVIRQGFETGAATKFDQLQSQQIQLAKMDARIAAIALFRGLILLTRNHRDFSKVSGLLIEDWTVA